MLVKLMCLECDHSFNDNVVDNCPNCGSKNIWADDFGTMDQDMDGHYEGDFPPQMSLDEIE